jgi:hypothetical protein
VSLATDDQQQEEEEESPLKRWGKKKKGLGIESKNEHANGK